MVSIFGLLYLLPSAFGTSVCLIILGYFDSSLVYLFLMCFLIMDQLPIKKLPKNKLSRLCYNYVKYSTILIVFGELVCLYSRPNSDLGIYLGLLFSWLLAIAPIHELSHSRHVMDRCLAYALAFPSWSVRLPLLHIEHHKHLGKKFDVDCPHNYGYFFPYYVVKSYVFNNFQCLRFKPLQTKLMILVFVASTALAWRFNSEFTIIWFRCVVIFIPIYSIVGYTTHPEEFGLNYQYSILKASNFWLLNVLLHEEHHHKPLSCAFELNQISKNSAKNGMLLTFGHVLLEGSKLTFAKHT
jgi:hypothetical protein